MDCVTSPVDQVFPEADEDVRVTDPPVQNVVGPPAKITGAGGAGLTTTVVAEDAATHPDPFPTVTV